MAVFSKFESFVEALGHGIHDFSTHEYRLAFCTNANAPTGTDALLGDLTTVALTNLTTNDDLLVMSASGQTGGIFRVFFADQSLTADGGDFGPFRFVVIYNATATDDPLVAYYNLGTDVTIPNGNAITLDFSDSLGCFSIT